MTYRALFALLCAFSLSIFSPFAAAQASSWPSKTIFIIISVPPGGIMGNLARILGDEIAAALNATVVVEGKPGAGGMIAAEYVLNATPDGHTLLLTTNAQMAVTPHLQKVRFNTLTDLKHISQVALAQNLLVVRPGLPVNNVQELIAYAKASPGKLSYGSSGAGSLQHIGAEVFQRMTGTSMVHVPYNGPAGRQNLLGGYIDLMFGDMGAVPLVQAGTLRGLAVTGAQRHPMLPNVPTIAETGLSGYAVEGSFVLSAPAKTPAAITEKLEDVVAKALRKPDVIKRIEGVTMQAAPDASSKYVNDALQRDFRNYGRLIQEANIKVQ